jgi:trans-aconitate methyltransferase
MELSQAMDLIRHPGMTKPVRARWADLGCGSGLFTYALANLLPNGSHIFAIDKIPVVRSPLPQPPRTEIEFRQADFVTQALPLSDLDGILMANSLHYVPDKPALLQKLLPCLRPAGCFVIVEYDTDVANPWVPYPIRYTALPDLFANVGFASATQLAERPSRYGRANLYAAYISQ